jgi:hypothetical protein
MDESKKFADNKIIGKQLSVDSDELQLLDECNHEWVDAWKAAAEQMTELELHVIEEPITQTMLVETKKP